MSVIQGAVNVSARRALAAGKGVETEEEPGLKYIKIQNTPPQWLTQWKGLSQAL